LFRSVYRATNFSADYDLITGSVYGLEYLDTGLLTNRQYKYKVQAVLLDQESEKSRPSNLLSPGTRFLINYYEGNEELGNSTKYGTSTLNYHVTNGISFQGSNSMALTYSYTGPGWGAALYTSFPASLDLSVYTVLRMSVKGDGSTNKVKIGLLEARGADPEIYVTRNGILLTNTQWKEYEFYLSDFEKTSGTGNGIFEKDAVAGYQITYDTRGVSTAEHFIDHIYLLNLATTLQLSAYSVGFGNVRFQSNDKRVQTDSVLVYTENLPSPYTIRIYTDDGSESMTNSGLQGQRYSTYWLPVKVWCDNFGPEFSTNTNKGPDEENDYFWGGYDFNGDTDKSDYYSGGIFTEGTNSGEYPFDLDGDGFSQGDVFSFSNYNLSEESKWLWIPEKNEMNPVNHWTWRRLSYTGSDLPSPFKIFLGVDLQGVKPQLYKGTIIVEVLIE
ncbi:MAG: CIA30 family protein, partial [bacterium]|nr:CIA30 family protein [bacterium]